MSLVQTIKMNDIKIMNKICLKCNEDFTTHSFNCVGHSLDGGHIFYTKISSASKYDDTEGIYNHCLNYLNYINPEKWSWIIDFEGFGLKHTLGINTGLQLSYLINKFGRLNHIIIINANIFVEQMIKMIKITLNKEYHSCIKFLNPNSNIKYIIEKWSYDNDHQSKTIKQILDL
jgi:hypothetical protein